MAQAEGSTPMPGAPLLGLPVAGHPRVTAPNFLPNRKHISPIIFSEEDYLGDERLHVRPYEFRGDLRDDGVAVGAQLAHFSG
jgi:hypothetical protein